MALADNLITYWKLDDSSNLIDSVGLLTLTNNGSVTFGTGKINQGATFDNTTTKSLTSSGPAFGTAGSLSFWANVVSGDDGYITDASSANRYYFIINSNGSTACNFNGTVMPAFSASGFPFGQWNHVVVTWDNSLGSNKEALYLNGSLYANTNNTIAASTPTTFYIGNRFSNTGAQDALNGTVDEIGIWTRALSASEITTLYNGGSGLQYPFPQSYTMTADVGAFTLTGINVNLRQGYNMVASVGSFILTGIDAVLRKTGIDWTNQNKSSAPTWTNSSKNSATWTNSSKNSSTWSNQSKS